MKYLIPLAVAIVSLLCGCATPPVQNQPTTSVVPSLAGIPNSVAILGNYEFVSVQGTSQIFTYNISTGAQVLAVPAYTTPCVDPSGMVLTTIGDAKIMAVVCFDTASLLTLTVHADGSLSALGSVAGLQHPYPGIALEGTNVYVPLFGRSGAANGAIARVSIASPAVPVITATTALASPAAGQFVDPSYLAIADGYIYIVAGSESPPQETSSSIQVVNESTMNVAGTPFLVAHSPQQIALQGTVAYVTMFDASQLESIDISNPANLHLLEMAPLASANSHCSALPIAVRGATAYVGCYEEGFVEQVDISNPTNLRLTHIFTGIPWPQRILPTAQSLLIPSSITGGRVYQLNLTP